MEKRGIPTVTICSDMFVRLAKILSASKGLSSLPLVVIPHPLGGITPQEVGGKADKAVDGVVRLLTESHEKLVGGF